jgi:hypothetical protein
MQNRIQFIENWFNPMEFDHIAAYKHMRDTGTIPTDIVPSNVQISPHSFALMTEKMAKYWITHMDYIKNKIDRAEKEKPKDN